MINSLWDALVDIEVFAAYTLTQDLTPLFYQHTQAHCN